MRLLFPVAFGLILATAMCAADNPQIIAARESVKRLKILAEAGAASRGQLAQAEDDLADAEDDAVINDGLRSKDLTETQADDMEAAAGRRLERRQKAFDKAQKMVEGGLSTQASLAPLQSDLEFARKERDLVGEVASVTRQVAAMAQLEASLPRTLPQTPNAALPSGSGHGVSESSDGNGKFTPAILASVESAYQSRFGKPLPISAMGETAVHRALGFDHTGRVDVALNPDQPEGIWLRQYLAENRIPYFAFWQAVPGKATGAHIHLGPQSTRLSSRNAGPGSARASAAE
jgi:hypothetical protein